MSRERSISAVPALAALLAAACGVEPASEDRRSPPRVAAAAVATPVSGLEVGDGDAMLVDASFLTGDATALLAELDAFRRAPLAASAALLETGLAEASPFQTLMSRSKPIEESRHMQAACDSRYDTTKVGPPYTCGSRAGIHTISGYYQPPPGCALAADTSKSICPTAVDSTCVATRTGGVQVMPRVVVMALQDAESGDVVESAYFKVKACFGYSVRLAGLDPVGRYRMASWVFKMSADAVDPASNLYSVNAWMKGETTTDFEASGSAARLVMRRITDIEAAHWSRTPQTRVTRQVVTADGQGLDQAETGLLRERLTSVKAPPSAMVHAYWHGVWKFGSPPAAAKASASGWASLFNLPVGRHTLVVRPPNVAKPAARFNIETAVNADQALEVEMPAACTWYCTQKLQLATGAGPKLGLLTRQVLALPAGPGLTGGAEPALARFRTACVAESNGTATDLKAQVTALGASPAAVAWEIKQTKNPLTCVRALAPEDEHRRDVLKVNEATLPCVALGRRQVESACQLKVTP